MFINDTSIKPSIKELESRIRLLTTEMDDSVDEGNLEKRKRILDMLLELEKEKEKLLNENNENKNEQDPNKIETVISLNACSICGKVEFLPYKCSLCGERFCGIHRLPEAHKCSPDYEYINDKEHEKKAKKIERLEIEIIRLTDITLGRDISSLSRKKAYDELIKKSKELNKEKGI